MKTKSKLMILLLGSLLILAFAACGSDTGVSAAENDTNPIVEQTVVTVDDDADEAVHDDDDDHDAEATVLADHDATPHEDTVGEAHEEEESEADGHAHGKATVDPDAPVVHFFASEFGYETTVTELEAGHPFTVQLHNEGVHEHDLTFEGLEDLGGIHLLPGEDDKATFIIDEPGSYTYYCTVPGHKEAGMAQTLEVVAGDLDDHDDADAMHEDDNDADAVDVAGTMLDDDHDADAPDAAHDDDAEAADDDHDAEDA